MCEQHANACYACFAEGLYFFQTKEVIHLIKTSILLKLMHKLLDICQSDSSVVSEEIHEAIHKFFTTDEQVVGTDNEGQADSYYETIRDMFLETTEQIDGMWQERDPDNHTPLF